MFTRVLAVAMLALFGSTAALARTCNCKPEISNASAEVSSSCSKIWSNNHCTLKEANNSTTQLRQRFANNRSLGISRLYETFSQVFDHRYSDMFPAHELAEQFMSYDYIFRAEHNCRSSKVLDQRDLVMILINPLLKFDEDNSITLLLEPQAISSLVQSMIDYNVETEMCTSSIVMKRTLSNSILFWGKGCLVHGNSESYFATDLGGFSECLSEIDFPAYP